MESYEFIGVNDDGDLNLQDLKTLEGYSALADDNLAEDADDFLEHIDSMKPNIVNLVASVKMCNSFDLLKISEHIKNAEFNPRRFQAVILRITTPKATAMVFQVGKVNIVGTREKEVAYQAAKKFCRILRKVGYNCRIEEFNVTNLVATIACNFRIRLQEIANHPGHRQLARYNPETFPGIIYRIPDPKVTLLIFESGKIIMTGAKSYEDLQRASNWIQPILTLFKKTQVVPPPAPAPPLPPPVAEIKPPEPVPEKNEEEDLFHKKKRRKPSNPFVKPPRS
ncbi:TATA-box-binding protein [Histomonas meleagridis]|uniref:TATA-box-binding protein n=1 Tax=Histomonas meleagridis TaxID=135588 RepID=UPI00355A7AF3|nr:TATA-box-binding protein [Histomonas meleagridis]KAH0800000.1 TATA-box-binding protein [Histomonas meleagridis]